MRTLYSICLAAMFALVINAAPVRGAEPIVYVSASGNDNNLCTFAAPCRNFQRAVGVVQVGGTVQALNAASYGNVTINKSLTISGGGNVVGLGSRITINNAGAIVVLRGLVMDGRGLGSGLNGIQINSAAAVHIEDSEIARYTGNGIQLAGTGATELYVSDTVSRENIRGLYVNNANALVAVENSRFENNTTQGLFLLAARVNVLRSVASGNSASGIYIQSATANLTETTSTDNTNSGFYFDNGAGVTLASSLARGNNIGVEVIAGANVLITDSVISSNPSAAISNAGTVYTRQNNTVGGNVTGNPVQPYAAF